MNHIFSAMLLVLFLQVPVAADPQLDVEKLMNDMLPFGQEMLEQRGEFLPYGAAMRIDGEIVSITSGAGVENPESQKMIDALKDTFQEGAVQERYKATALFYDVTTVLSGTGMKTDAIAVALDHKDNLSVTVFLPYTRVGTSLVFGQTFARHGSNDIFAR